MKIHGLEKWWIRLYYEFKSHKCNSDAWSVEWPDPRSRSVFLEFSYLHCSICGDIQASKTKYVEGHGTDDEDWVWR